MNRRPPRTWWPVRADERPLPEPVSLARQAVYAGIAVCMLSLTLLLMLLGPRIVSAVLGLENGEILWFFAIPLFAVIPFG